MTVTVAAALVLTLFQAPALLSAPAQAPRPMTLREAVARQHVRPDSALTRALHASPAHGHPSMARKVAFVAGGAAGGLLLGAVVGAKIADGIGCDCFLPGLRGAVIGGIGGAAGGAVLGAWLAGRRP